MGSTRTISWILATMNKSIFLAFLVILVVLLGLTQASPEPAAAPEPGRKGRRYYSYSRPSYRYRSYRPYYGGRVSYSRPSYYSSGYGGYGHW